MKKPFNFRLSSECERELYFLAGRLRLNNTTVVEHAIKYYYQSYLESMAGNPVMPFKLYEHVK